MPLHFTLQRRNKVVLHMDPIEGHEVLDVYERVSRFSSIMSTRSSFQKKRFDIVVTSALLI